MTISFRIDVQKTWNWANLPKSFEWGTGLLSVDQTDVLARAARSTKRSARKKARVERKGVKQEQAKSIKREKPVQPDDDRLEEQDEEQYEEQYEEQDEEQDEEHVELSVEGEEQQDDDEGQVAACEEKGAGQGEREQQQATAVCLRGGCNEPAIVPWSGYCSKRHQVVATLPHIHKSLLLIHIISSCSSF